MVLLNASAAFVAAGMDPGFHEGMERARESIDTGRAMDKLERLVEFTRQCGGFVRKEMLGQ
jgi:anthranilate phosphoribosyltransferase